MAPSVWTGRALQAESDDLESWSCASVSGLLMEPLSSWPSWISARVRSHSRLGPEGQKGHLITNALARPFSISSFRLADLGGKANSTIVLGASLSVSHSLSEFECFRLPPSLVGNIAKDCIFLDAERNFTKPEPDDCSSLIRVNSVFGLVEEFTGVTTRQDSRATTLVRGVLTSGVLRDVDALSATLKR